MAWALFSDGRVRLIDLRGSEEVNIPRIPALRRTYS